MITTGMLELIIVVGVMLVIGVLCYLVLKYVNRDDTDH